MKKITILFAFLIAGFGLIAQEEYKLSKSSVKMSGTSTLHDWTADVTKVSGNGKLTFANNALSGIKALNINMTTNSIKSSKGETMDKNMNKELKAKEHPTMTYSLTKVNSINQKAGVYTLETEGKLTIAGTTKSVSLSVTGKQSGNEITFKGSTKLKMTDFKVEPPVMFLGTLKTADDVTINFEATFTNNGLTSK